jgi:transposase
MEKMESPRLIFLDESGSHLGMSRTHGRIEGNARLKMPIPLNKGTRVSMIAAIGLKDIRTSHVEEGAVNGTIFKEFVERRLCPCLQPGDTVIMDNLSVHKVPGIQKAIEAKGATLLYLPPYSPDLSPIEMMWSKMKTYLRKKAARTLEDLYIAIQEAFSCVSSQDLQGWFKHCGYSIQ